MTKFEIKVVLINLSMFITVFLFKDVDIVLALLSAILLFNIVLIFEWKSLEKLHDKINKEFNSV